MPRFFRPLPGVALALALLLAPGCDTGAPGDPTDLLDDARIARQGGDLDQATELYERALEAQPNSAVVRVEFASTVLQRADVDLLDLDRIAVYVSEAQQGAGTRPAPAPAADGFGAT